MSSREAIIRSVVLVALAAVSVALCKVFPNAATNPQAGMELELPGRIEGYRVVDIPPGEKELYWLPADTGIKKHLYQKFGATSDSDILSVTLILAGSDRRSLHRPEVCLDGQGFTITDKEVVTLEVNGKPLKVMDFSLTRSTSLEDGTVVQRKAHYIYWWVGKNRSTPSDFKRILYTAFDNMFRNINSRWGYPSVMVWEDPDGGPDEEEKAREHAFDFIREHAPVFQKSLR